MLGPGPAHQAQLPFPSLFCTMEPEPVQPGMLIDICKYLDSLQYRVWRKMVMCVESGEQRPGQRPALSALLLPVLVPSPAFFILVPVPYSPLTPLPKPHLAECLPFLGPDTWPPLQKEKLASLSLQNRIVYVMKELLSSRSHLSRWFPHTSPSILCC